MRPRRVGPQFERGRAREPVPPVRERLLGLHSLCELTFLDRVFGVREHRWEDEWTAVTVGGITVGELAAQQIERPAVGDDVMEDDAEEMFVVRRAQQGHPEQGSAGEVESCVGPRGQQPSRIAGAASMALAQIDDLDPHRGGRFDHRDRPAVHPREPGAQRFVPCDDAVERGMQGHCRQFAGQPQYQRDVVRGVRGVQLVEKPQPFLAVCERTPVVTPVIPVARTGHAAHAPSPVYRPRKAAPLIHGCCRGIPKGLAADARSRGNSPVP